MSSWMRTETSCRICCGVWTERKWMDPVTENPGTGTVEVWEMYNTTGDAHPIPRRQPRPCGAGGVGLQRRRHRLPRAGHPGPGAIRHPRAVRLGLGEREAGPPAAHTPWPGSSRQARARPPREHRCVTASAATSRSSEASISSTRPDGLDAATALGRCSSPAIAAQVRRAAAPHWRAAGPCAASARGTPRASVLRPLPACAATGRDP